MLQSPSDTRASLVLRLRDQNDLAAWDEVLAVYRPLVLRMALKQGLQRADAEDVVQNVFVAVFRSVDDWLAKPQRGRFRSWLLGICRNVALNTLNRHPKGGVGVGGSDALDMLNQLQDSDPKFASEFDLEYQRQVYRWAAEQLQKSTNALYWEAFYRTHILGNDIRNVAKELGIEIGTVYVARSRVMSQLKDKVKQYSEDYDVENR